MVEVKEIDNAIQIKIKKNSSVNIEYVYNNNYFYSIGLDVIDIKKGGEILKNTLDKSEKAFDDTANIVFKTVGNIVKPLTDQIKSNDDFLIFNIKKSEDSNFYLKTFDEYLNEIKSLPQLNPLAVFPGTGIDVVKLDNIVTDIMSCLDYINTYGFCLLQKTHADIFVINDRFVILTDNLTKIDETQEEQNALEFFTLLCGMKYERGEFLFPRFIKDTIVCKKLESLIHK